MDASLRWHDDQEAAGPSSSSTAAVIAVAPVTIAGSDSGGGAGIQADLKTFSALGVYGASVITALTAQNTRGVTGVHTPPASFLTQQLDAISTDVRIDAIKIGMLANAAVISAVAKWISGLSPKPVVVLDPVMIATSGDRLLDADAEREPLSGEPCSEYGEIACRPATPRWEAPERPYCCCCCCWCCDHPAGDVPYCVPYAASWLERRTAAADGK